MPHQAPARRKWLAAQQGQVSIHCMMHRAYPCKQAGFVPAMSSAADQASACRIYNFFRMLDIKKNCP
jgi:hypothetical protein